ncbi:MAG: helix-hairpin-helix domain-containing protein [Chloroflexota bacterium]
MLRGLVRLLVRLFVFGLIAAAVGFVVTRLMGGEDEDFEDFDDLESSFEFNETPVEIEVSENAGATSAPSNQTKVLSSTTVESHAASDAADTVPAEVPEGPRLIDIKGIGPSYETRLHSIGIKTMQDLIDADANNVAEELGVIGGATEVADWVVQAHTFLSEKQG